MGDLLDPFEIRTGVRKEDGISPSILNCAQEKVITEWLTPEGLLTMVTKIKQLET